MLPSYRPHCRCCSGRSLSALGLRCHACLWSVPSGTRQRHPVHNQRLTKRRKQTQQCNIHPCTRTCRSCPPPTLASPVPQGLSEERSFRLERAEIVTRRSYRRPYRWHTCRESRRRGRRKCACAKWKRLSREHASSNGCLTSHCPCRRCVS